jgi:serine/threonine-protein kinase
VRVVHGGIAGTVVAQIPKPGAFMHRGETVTIEITVGARQIAVPQVASMPVDQARDVLTRAGFSVAAVVYRDYPDREPGRVVATSPPPGTQVDQGTGVELYVPLPPHVP